MGKTTGKYEYKKRWRVIEKKRKHHNSFVTEYVKVKFGNVYNEANCFFNALTSIHPEKLDVKKTKEFKEWKKSIMNTENPEVSLIVQTLRTDVSYGENNQETEQNYTVNNQENHHDDSDESETEMDNNEENHHDDSDESEKETDNNSDESEKETDNNSDESEKETDNNSDESETETDNNEENYHDDMLLEIPLERYLPQPTQHKTTQTANNNRPETETEAPSNNNDYDFEPFTDERLQQIVAELRNDPELQNLFYEPAENLSDQDDEGVELRTLEEELEVDIEPFDYRLEVELSDW